MTSEQPSVDERIAAADGMRRLSHAMVGHHVDADSLREICEFTQRIAPRVEAGVERDLALEFLVDPDVQQALAVGDIRSILPGTGQSDLFGNTIVSGRSNPMGLAARYTFGENEVSTRVVLGKAFEGAPGMAHGGIVAAVVDETMGAVLPLAGTMAFTGQLTINYRAPTPIGVELEFRARLDRREGRKLWISCNCTRDEALLVEAEGLFIAVDMNLSPDS